MSPKARFQLMLEPEQLEQLRRIERETDVPVSRQIRRAITLWLSQPGFMQEVVQAFDESGFASGGKPKVSRSKTALRRAGTRRKA